MDNFYPSVRMILCHGKLKLRAGFLIGFALVTVSCTRTIESSPNAVRAEGTAVSTAPPKVETPSTAKPLPPIPTTYTPLPGEIEPSAKREAAKAVSVIASYALNQGTAEGLTERLTANNFSDALMPPAMGLQFPDSASVGEVVYAQFGGLTKTQASVMVILHQSLLARNEVRMFSRTIDVRLSKTPQGWSVSKLIVPEIPTGALPLLTLDTESPEAGRAPKPSPAALALLNTSRVDLPDTARMDLKSGGIDPRIADLLLDLSSRFVVSVSVLSSGHPQDVFGTSRVSNHTSGRGVDIWSVDGIPVVSQHQDGSAAQRLVAEALIAKATEVGSPWDLDGPGGPSFTNMLHADHIHIAFDK